MLGQGPWLDRRALERVVIVEKRNPTVDCRGCLRIQFLCYDEDLLCNMMIVHVFKILLNLLDKRATAYIE